ncbi:MAG: hypothetical protein QOG28_2936, partial [Trebonia sp.]|nr:hypothetical protein [Trebonia sp.]
GDLNQIALSSGWGSASGVFWLDVRR